MTYSCESQADLVVDADRRDDHAELGRDLAADRADARAAACRRRRCRRAARGRSRSPARAGRAPARRAPASRGAAGARQRRPAAAVAAAARSLALVRQARRAARSRRRRTAPPMTRNGSFGRPGTSANAQITTPATSGALRWSRIWPATSRAEVLLGGRARDEDAGGDRDQQRRDLRAQAVADRQQREVVDRPRRNGMPCCIDADRRCRRSG